MAIYIHLFQSTHLIALKINVRRFRMKYSIKKLCNNLHYLLCILNFFQTLFESFAAENIMEGDFPYDFGNIENPDPATNIYIICTN